MRTALLALIALPLFSSCLAVVLGGSMVIAAFQAAPHIQGVPISKPTTPAYPGVTFEREAGALLLASPDHADTFVTWDRDGIVIVRGDRGRGYLPWRAHARSLGVTRYWAPNFPGIIDVRDRDGAILFALSWHEGIRVANSVHQVPEGAVPEDVEIR